MLTRRHYVPRRKKSRWRLLHDAMTRMIELIVETGSCAKKGDEPKALEMRLFEAAPLHLELEGFHPWVETAP